MNVAPGNLDQARAALDRVRAWVIDVDGCLVRTDRPGGAGGEAIPGAAELLALLRDRGDQVLVCTNASERPPEEYAVHLRELGLDIHDDQFITAGSAAADYICFHHPGKSVLVVGGEGLSEPLRTLGATVIEPGTELADVVVVGAGRNYPGDLINAACLAVDAGAPLYTTIDVPWFHGGRGKSVSVSAAIATAISWVTGAEATVLGKPSVSLAETLARRFREGSANAGESTSAHSAAAGPIPTAVLGDATVEVELARHMDALALLVLSGATSAEQVPTLNPPHQPDLVFTNVGELHHTFTTGENS